MPRLCVVARPDLADGFRLAGAEIHPTGSAELAVEVVRRLLRQQDVGLIALEADFYGALDDRLRRQIDRSLRPVVMAIPVGHSPALGERRSRFVAALIQRAIGFRISVE